MAKVVHKKSLHCESFFKFIKLNIFRCVSSLGVYFSFSQVQTVAPSTPNSFPNSSKVSPVNMPVFQYPFCKGTRLRERVESKKGNDTFHLTDLWLVCILLPRGNSTWCHPDRFRYPFHCHIPVNPYLHQLLAYRLRHLFVLFRQSGYGIGTGGKLHRVVKVRATMMSKN